MEEYRRLTKSSHDGAGESVVTCAFIGTEHCVGNCAVCPVMGAILKQLCAFEEAFIDTLEK